MQWRMLGASVLLGLLFVFFLPIVYNSSMFQCGAGTVCLSNRSGLQSIGYALFNWGAIYSFGYGASSPMNGYFAPSLDGLTSWAVLLIVVFPVTVATVTLLAPEIVRISRVARFGLVAFGAFVAILSGLAVVTPAPQPSLIEIIFLPLIWAGGLIVVYGARKWIFSPTVVNGMVDQVPANSRG